MPRLQLLVAPASAALVALPLAACAGDGIGSTSEAVAAESSAAPNDPLLTNQWSLTTIRVPEAWALNTGSPQTVIAVLDSGTYPHEDLDGRFGPGGYDFFSGDPDPTDADSTSTANYHHGIHVAGILGAATNNGKGVAGICQGCSIMAERIEAVHTPLTDPNPPTPIATLATIRARAIRYAAGLVVDDGTGRLVQAPQRAAVVNISLGNIPAPCDPEVQAALDAAWSVNTVVVAAVSNARHVSKGAQDCSHRLSVPCDAPEYYWPTCQHVITVTSATADGVREAYAPGGTGVTIAAPGGAADANGFEGTGDLVGCTGAPPLAPAHGILSTWVTDTGERCYRYWAGTSMATPHVAGVIALMKSASPALTNEQVLAIVKGTATHAQDCLGCGAGVIDALGAVAASPFSASASCAQTTQGHFSCTASIAGGLAPTGSWAAGAGATITSQSSLSAAGTCAGSASVAFTASDAAGRQVAQTASFSCAAGHLVVTTPIVFDQVVAGGSATQVLVATNTGNAPVTLSSEILAEQSGPAALTFAGPVLPTVIPPGGMLSHTITCSPPIEATTLATFTIASDADDPSVSSNLLCRGVPPHIAFTPANGVALGDTAVGGTSSATFSLRNTTGEIGTTLRFRADSPAPDFSLSCDSGCTCADGSCTGTVDTVAAVLRVSFAPKATGAQQSTVRITANDPDRPMTSVTVTGHGILKSSRPGPGPRPGPIGE